MRLEYYSSKQTQTYIEIKPLINFIFQILELDLFLYDII